MCLRMSVDALLVELLAKIVGQRSQVRFLLTGFLVGRRGFHRVKQERDSDAPCRAGDRKCPALIWFRRAFRSAPGGCSGTPHGWFESTPEPVRVAVVVAAPLYGQSLAGALLKNSLPMMLRAWCQGWLLFGLCWFCRVRVLGAVSHS